MHWDDWSSCHVTIFQLSDWFIGKGLTPLSPHVLSIGERARVLVVSDWADGSVLSPLFNAKFSPKKTEIKIHMEKAQWNSHIWAMQKNGEYFIFRKGDSSHYCVVESRNTTLFQILDLTPLFYLSMLLLSNIASAYLIIFIYDAEMVLETKVSVIVQTYLHI